MRRGSAALSARRIPTELGGNLTGINLFTGELSADRGAQGRQIRPGGGKERGPGAARGSAQERKAHSVQGNSGSACSTAPRAGTSSKRRAKVVNEGQSSKTRDAHAASRGGLATARPRSPRAALGSLFADASGRRDHGEGRAGEPSCSARCRARARAG